jgi:2-dehydropantoate 2-reductase
MKIAVVGCGAVGSYYGALLARAGHDVHFLLRSDYAVVKRKGVSIRSPQGDFNVRPRPARRPEEIGPADLVIIGLKTTANAVFPTLLPPLVGKQTAVLTLQNGLGNEDQLAKLFPREQILGGLCFVCLNRIEPGVIHHIAHGMVVTGEFAGWPEPRTHDIASAFRAAGVPCKVTANLEKAHWEKLVWNIPFNGLGVAGVAGIEAFMGRDAKVQRAKPKNRTTLTTQDLLGDKQWEAIVRELMLEVIHAARAQKLRIPESLAEKQIERTRSMGPYKASTLLDFEKGQRLELESLFLEPLRRAEAAGVKVPRLNALCEVLQALNPAG